MTNNNGSSPLGTVDYRILARRFAERRNINLDEVPPPPPFNPVDHHLARVQDLIEARFPRRFRCAHPSHPGVLRWVQLYLTNREDCPNLLVLGPTGPGKTTEAYGALRHVLLELAKRGERITFAAVNHPDFHARLDVSKYDPHHAEAQRMLDNLGQVDLLLFDELSGGKTYDATEIHLYRLVNTRWENQRPMIVTTNLPPDQLRDLVDERIVSRLADSIQVTMQGPDRRRERGEVW